MVQGQGEAACWHGRKQGFAHLERSPFARNGAQRLLPDGDAVALAYLQGRSDQGVGTRLLQFPDADRHELARSVGRQALAVRPSSLDDRSRVAPLAVPVSFQLE